MWLNGQNLIPRVRKLALATQFVPASQIDCERIWKKVGAVMTKHRGSLQVKTAADQVFVKMMWEVAHVIPGLGGAIRRFD
jgi:hypothetical protein